MVDWINFNFSTTILSNSRAGIYAFTPPVNKTKVIYNGINPGRFENLPATEPLKAKYGIKTPFSVVMVATFSNNKDYGLFFRIAEKITSLRDDITFVAVGASCANSSAFERFYELTSGNPRIKLTGRINHVEAVINCCTIGVLFSNTAVHGEGISNSIIEYMSLAKPVIANDAGGTREIVRNHVNGYLVTGETENEMIAMITGLIDDPGKCAAFGKAGRKMIEDSFLLNKMGKAFEETYRDILTDGKIKSISRIMYPS
jgi:glycosyltransferase involved in cell wall biosynthesis